MPMIVEDDDTLRLPQPDIDALVQAGLIALCHGCDNYHHEEYERWDEIRAALQVIQRARAVLIDIDPPS